MVELTSTSLNLHGLSGVSSESLAVRLRSTEVETPGTRSGSRDGYSLSRVNPQLPILAVGRLSDFKVVGHAFSDDLDPEQQRLCYAMTEKIVKRSNKLIKEIQEGKDTGRPPNELKKLAWKFPEQAEEGCFLVKLNEARTFVFIVFAMSRHYPEKLVKDLLRELAGKVDSLVTGDDLVAEESVTHNLLPKMAKLVQSFETTNFEKYVKSVEQISQISQQRSIQVTVSPPQALQPRFSNCVRKLVILIIILAVLGGGIYLVVWARRRSANGASSHMALLLL